MHIIIIIVLVVVILFNFLQFQKANKATRSHCSAACPKNSVATTENKWHEKSCSGISDDVHDNVEKL